MKARKTIEVSKVKDIINGMLLNSSDDKDGMRTGLMVALENILMDTGNYHGFRYLTSDDMEKSEYGRSVGVRHDLPQESWFKDTDHTRVYYF